MRHPVLSRGFAGWLSTQVSARPTCTPTPGFRPSLGVAGDDNDNDNDEFTHSSCRATRRSRRTANVASSPGYRLRLSAHCE